MQLRKSAAFTAALCLTGSFALADNIAMSPNTSSGSQQFDTLFGMDFQVNSQPIQVTQLGVFDNNADGVLNTDNNGTQPIVVSLWDVNTGTQLASLNFGAGTGNGTDTNVGAGKVFFKPLSTPVTLAAGDTYYIGEDYSGAEQFFNSNGNTATAPTPDSSGLITFVGGGRASNVHGLLFTGSNSATTTSNGFIDGGPPARYAGPNFAFTTVPEPASVGVMGVVACGLLARRRRLA